MGFISVEDPKPNVFGSDPDPEESGCQRQIKQNSFKSYMTHHPINDLRTSYCMNIASLCIHTLQFHIVFIQQMVALPVREEYIDRCQLH